MSKTILAEVDGWTPLIDHLSREYGLIRSAVFGRIWRYCQGSQQVCSASLETISLDLGVDKSTVMRHAKALCEDGYLKDMTPDARNVPHIYADTGKAGIAIRVTARPDLTVAQSNASVAHSNKSVAENQLKKEVRKNLRDSRGEEFSVDAKDVAINPNDKYKERTRVALQHGIETHMEDELAGIDLTGYPADVVDVVREVCKVWGLRTPMQKSKRAKWIQDAREVIHVCGELGMEPIRRERQRVVDYMQKNQGLSPYTYKDIGSLVGPIGGLAAQMRTNGNGNKVTGAPVLQKDGAIYV